MRLTCMIIDDEPLAVTLLESYVKKTPFLELKGAFNSAIDALSVISDDPPNLMFLDIQMPELSGMEFSHMISTETRIIFTTAFEKYAFDSYKVNALDYLLKPVSYPDFLKSSQKALQWYEMIKKAKISVQLPGNDTASTIMIEDSDNSANTSAIDATNFINSNTASATTDANVADSTAVSATSAINISHAKAASSDTIFIKADRKLIQVRLADILYVEGLKDYVKIHVEGQPYPILSLMTMKSMEELLPRSRFVRVHRSFIVQPDKIKVIERSRIVFGKVHIPISDSYKATFAEFVARRTLTSL